MTTKSTNNNKLNCIGLCLCILFSVITMIPYLILGEDSIITYHDQLDGELLTYILNAKYLFKNISKYPELMNGISRNGVVSPAPGLVIFFYLFKPFTAFLVSKFFIQTVSVCAMYTLLLTLFNNQLLAMLLGMTYMMLPFYTVYGLCIPGLPLVMLALIYLNCCNRRNNFIAYILLAIYAVNSSLSLIGFAVVGVLSLYIIYLLMSHKRSYPYILAEMELIIIYILTNLGLVRQLFIPNSFVSHRSEIAILGIDFMQNAKQLLLYGDDYANSMQQYYFVFIILGLILALKAHKTSKNGSENVSVLILKNASILTMCIFAFSSLYQTEYIASIRSNLSGALHDFNLSRVSWLMPLFWFLMLGASLTLIQHYILSKNTKARKILAPTFLIISVLPTIFFAAYNNDLKYNVMKLLKSGDYYMITWKQFFAEDLFEGIADDINLSKSDYRVVSYGIYPAAAAYNGFYCLDAYSNNYDVEYKHSFQQIIQDELNQSTYLTSWFVEWGNRCYIVQSSTNNYFTFEKRWTPCVDRLNLDLEQLKKMGCHYIISAAYVFNPEDSGLTLIGDERVSENSWYRLWLYTF